jgi:hypothetical protein
MVNVESKHSAADLELEARYQGADVTVWRRIRNSRTWHREGSDIVETLTTIVGGRGAHEDFAAVASAMPGVNYVRVMTPRGLLGAVRVDVGGDLTGVDLAALGRMAESVAPANPPHRVFFHEVETP